MEDQGFQNKKKKLTEKVVRVGHRRTEWGESWNRPENIGGFQRKLGGTPWGWKAQGVAGVGTCRF